MKEFIIYVDGAGFGVDYILKAKDLRTAKAKAKKMAIADFKKTLKAVKVVY